MKIITWNVNGLRAAINKGFWDKVGQINPDIICLQEIKTDDLKMQKLVLENAEFLENWCIFWHSADKLGYSGTAILYRKSKFIPNTRSEKKSLFENINSAKNPNQPKINQINQEIISINWLNSTKNEKPQNFENWKTDQTKNPELVKIKNKNLELDSQKAQKLDIQLANQASLAKNTELEIELNFGNTHDEEMGEKLEIGSSTLKSETLEKWQISQEIVGLGNSEFDLEGRTTGLILENVLTENLGQTENCQSKTSKNSIPKKVFLLLNCYYPQGGRVGRVDYKLRFYQQVLDFVSQKILEYPKIDLQIILTGDFNTTFKDIDLARPKENRQTTGCLPAERQILNLLCQKLNLVDVYRVYFPNLQEFTYWDQITRARERNVGWRIDFFLVSKNLLNGKKTAEFENLEKNRIEIDKITETGSPNNSQNVDFENQENKQETQTKNLLNKQKKRNEEPKIGQNHHLENLKIQNNNQYQTLNYSSFSQENIQNFPLKIQKVEILTQVLGSDHCPVLLEISQSLETK